MNRLKNLFRSKDKVPPIFHVRHPIWKVFLLGLRGIFEIHSSKPYNFYFYVSNILLGIFLGKYVVKSIQNELEQRYQPNLFVPQYIYKVRKEHHIYWELSRLARGLSTTFTYYEWDTNTKMMYMVDRSGKQTPFHVHNRIEDPDIMANPLMEKHYPASAEIHSIVSMYIKNINNPYDLNNHLHHRSVNMGDWLRAIYYFVYRYLGLTNRWRYDEYVSKPDVYYEWYQAKLAYRINKDRQSIYRFFERWMDTDSLKKFLIWFI